MPTKPLLSSPEEQNGLSMVPGQFYQYIVRYGSPKGEPLWKTPGGHTGTEEIMTHIPRDRPFMFVTLEIEGSPGRQDSGPGKRCWLRVIYKDLVGFININTYQLHTMIELVATEV